MTESFFQKTERDTYKETIEGRNVHDHLKTLSVEELYEETQKDRFPFHVMCMSLTGDLNIGNIIRSSILHGAEKVWVFGRKKYDRRGSVGSHNYINVETVYGFENETDYRFDLEKFHDICNENNLVPIFVEQGGVSLHEFDWSKVILGMEKYGNKPLLVFGNETNGVPENFLGEEWIVSVPQCGVIRSFNVGSTMAMVTWDMRRAMGWI